MSKLSLSVEALPKVKPPARVVALGPADLRDQRWLDERIARIEDGIEAVLDIARNWSEGMNLSRLHPGVSAQDYILGRVKSPLGRGVVVPLLAESNLSNRQIAALAGVDEGTVRNELRNIPQLDRPAETLGADGKLRAAVRERIRGDAAASEAELQEATADWTEAQRAAVRPEVMRQRGELMRLVHDMNGLPDAKTFARDHGTALSGEFFAEAMFACGWLETFCDELEGLRK